jgi:hypothetical protein
MEKLQKEATQLPFVICLLTPDTRLRGRSRFGAARARHLKPPFFLFNFRHS